MVSKEIYIHDVNVVAILLGHVINGLKQMFITVMG